MNVRRISLTEWSDALPRDGIEVFHTPDVLRIMDDHATGDLQLFGGFKGQELVGFFPVFVRDYLGVSVVLSPPPGFSVSRMGPVVMPRSPKRRKREELNRTFIETVLQAIGADETLTLFGTVLSTAHTDPRPYMWAGFDVKPRFTYCLDLQNTDEDEILSNFTRDLRSEIRKFRDVSIDVTIGGPEHAIRVYDDYRERFAEQGANFPTPREYTRDLVATLDDRARVYTAESPDGTFLGGITILYSNTTAYFWQGGMRANYQGLSVNSLLHWRIIQDILSDSALDPIERYDLGRAAVERLGRYKSKFGPDLVPYYEVKSGTLMILAKEAYKFITY